MAIASSTTLADYFIPARRISRRTLLVRDGLFILGFSIFLALCAQISLHLPFTPLPITLQTLAVLLAGATLGCRRGGLAMLLYLGEGAAGLPVFSGGTSGLVALLSYTGGYLWAFPIAAFVVGLLCERGLDRHIVTSAFSMLPGTLIIYAIGVSWLTIALHINFAKALVFGLVPFIPGDLLKLVIASALLPTAWAIVRCRTI